MKGRKEKRICKGFSSRLAGLIVQSGMKKNVIGARCGVTGAAVTKWCGGFSEPDLWRVVVLAKLFNVSTDWLLVGGSIEHTHGRIDDVIARLTRIEKELF